VSGPVLPDVGSVARGEVLVRSARPADLDALSRLLDGLALDPGGVGPLDPESVARILADPRRALLVAERVGRLVGTLDLIVVDNPTHGGAPWAMVENVVVDPESRRLGVGRHLVRRAVELAAAAGCYKVQLISDARRPPAHALYESEGFTVSVRGFRRYLGPEDSAAGDADP
jgi:GNAT superfamily N-acetyltransferase